MNVKVYYPKLECKGIFFREAETITRESMKDTHVQLPVKFDGDMISGMLAEHNLSNEFAAEYVFTKLNDFDNPMSTPEMQNWIRANGVSHTSMSVGDIVEIDDKMMVCMNDGWNEI